MSLYPSPTLHDDRRVRPVSAGELAARARSNRRDYQESLRFRTHCVVLAGLIALIGLIAAIQWSGIMQLPH